MSVPKFALTGLVNVTMTVSSTSSRESSTILPIVIITLVDPALIVKVPLARV